MEHLGAQPRDGCGCGLESRGETDGSLPADRIMTRSDGRGANTMKQARAHAEHNGDNPRWAERREEIVALAFAILQDSGLEHFDFGRIAERLGVRRNALFYYFDDRDALVYETVARTLEYRLRCIDSAIAEGGSGIAILQRYLTREITDRPAPLVPPLMQYTLAPAFTTRLGVRSREVLERITEILNMGHADGSIRPSNPAITANIIQVMASTWLGNNASIPKSVSRARIGPALADYVAHGILAPRRSIDQLAEASPDADPAHANGLVPDPEDVDSQRIEALLRHATDTFNRIGFGAASIPIMARQLGTSKTAFYQVARDKEELLYLCYLRGLHLVEESQRSADLLTAAAGPRLWLGTRLLLKAHGGPLGPIPRMGSMQSLAPAHHRMVLARRNAGAYRTRTRIASGIAQGWFRGVDNLVVQHLIGSLIYGLPVWHAGNDDPDLGLVADTGLAIIFEGLATH